MRSRRWAWMRSCIARKACPARATSSGPCSGSAGTCRSREYASAASASRASGRVATRAAHQVSAAEHEQLQRQVVEARLAAMQAQVEPHFLFNTLANVQALVEAGSPQAAPVLGSLIAYLRAAMPRLGAENATLGDEVALVRAYLELMLMRMPDRLAFEIDVPPELHGERFPAMALLTLVENAIRHGIDPAEQGGRISVSVRREGHALRVQVADTGAGLREHSATGTGLANLRERLLMFFGPQASLELAENEPRGVRAVLHCPSAGAP